MPASVRDGAVEAAHMFTLGLAKKTLIADVLAHRLVDPAFSSAHGISATSAWLGGFAYAEQLYFDFSGYSDMAVGLGLLLGLRLPRNFHLPYAAHNPSEFWRRWHVSLSTWLRDYLYIPLGGNRCSPARRRLNLFVTMVLGGLWHGANWTFVLWGAFHGLGLVLYDRKRASSTPRILAVAGTFLFVVVGWILFRAPSPRVALDMYRGMLGMNGLGLSALRQEGVGVAVLCASMALSFSADTYDVKWRPSARHAVVVAAILVACIMRLSQPSPFLYFQF
jgi:alginate O-acetyltransferase complex protein AlgI